MTEKKAVIEKYWRYSQSTPKELLQQQLKGDTRSAYA